MTLPSLRSTAKSPDGTSWLVRGWPPFRAPATPVPPCGAALIGSVQTSKGMATMQKASCLVCSTLAPTMAGIISPKKASELSIFPLGLVRPLTSVSDSELAMSARPPTTTKAAGLVVMASPLTTSPSGSRTRRSYPIHKRNPQPSVPSRTSNPDRNTPRPFKQTSSTTPRTASLQHCRTMLGMNKTSTTISWRMSRRSTCTTRRLNQLITSSLAAFTQKVRLTSEWSPTTTATRPLILALKPPSTPRRRPMCIAVRPQLCVKKPLKAAVKATATKRTSNRRAPSTTKIRVQRKSSTTMPTGLDTPVIPVRSATMMHGLTRRSPSLTST